MEEGLFLSTDGKHKITLALHRALQRIAEDAAPSIRRRSTGVPQPFRSRSAAVPQPFRTRSVHVPHQWCRTSAAPVPPPHGTTFVPTRGCTVRVCVSVRQVQGRPNGGRCHSRRLNDPVWPQQRQSMGAVLTTAFTATRASSTTRTTAAASTRRAGLRLVLQHMRRLRHRLGHRHDNPFATHVSHDGRRHQRGRSQRDHPLLASMGG